MLIKRHCARRPSSRSFIPFRRTLPFDRPDSGRHGRPCSRGQGRASEAALSAWREHENTLSEAEYQPKNMIYSGQYFEVIFYRYCAFFLIFCLDIVLSSGEFFRPLSSRLAIVVIARSPLECGPIEIVLQRSHDSYNSTLINSFRSKICLLNKLC